MRRETQGEEGMGGGQQFSSGGLNEQKKNSPKSLQTDYEAIWEKNYFLQTLVMGKYKSNDQFLLSYQLYGRGGRSSDCYSHSTETGPS